LECGSSYHIEFKPPAENGDCLNCGSKVIQRDDDQPETVKERIRIYNEQIFPVLSVLELVSDVINIDGEGSIQEVADRILIQLKEWKAKAL
jgi:adenylate kinase